MRVCPVRCACADHKLCSSEEHCGGSLHRPAHACSSCSAMTVVNLLTWPVARSTCAHVCRATAHMLESPSLQYNCNIEDYMYTSLNIHVKISSWLLDYASRCGSLIKREHLLKHVQIV